MGIGDTQGAKLCLKITHTDIPDMYFWQFLEKPAPDVKNAANRWILIFFRKFFRFLPRFSAYFDLRGSPPKSEDLTQYSLPLLVVVIFAEFLTLGRPWGVCRRCQVQAKLYLFHSYTQYERRRISLCFSSVCTVSKNISVSYTHLTLPTICSV